MKRYIRAAVSIENLKEQFGKDMEDELFQSIIDVDPTADYAQNKGGKYCRWLFEKYKAGKLTKDDFLSMHDALKDFARNSSRFEYTDLGRYKSAEEFLEDARRVGQLPLTEKQRAKMVSKQAHNSGDKDKVLLATHGNWELWQPLTHAGAVALARVGGTQAQWCTSYAGNDYHWKNYTSQGPLFIFINTANYNEKYQTHFESHSWMYDINDRRGTEEQFNKFISDKEEFQQALEYYVIDGCTIRAGNLIGIDSIAEVVDMSNLPIKVTHINANIFNNNSTVKKVILPNTLDVIADTMFRGCTALQEVVMPEGITTIGDDAFAGCHALATITLPNSVKSIGKNCFAYCLGLTNVKFSDSLETIGDSAFYSCLKLKSAKLPNTVTRIGNTAFLNCRSLTTVTLSKSLYYLGAHAFHFCTSLESIQIPKSVKEAGAKVFKGCVNLSEKSKASIEKASADLGVDLM